MKTILLSLMSVLVMAGVAPADQKETAAEKPKVVRIGAVASPGAVTVFRNLKTHLNRSGFPSDYVLYSTYDALVDALDRGEVAIAWNSPMSHAQYHIRNQCASQTLAMREGDRNLRQVMIVRKDSGIGALEDLTGKRLVLDKSKYQHELLSAHYLKKEGVDLDAVKIVDGENDSPEKILKALSEGRADAAIIRESAWKRATDFREKNPAIAKIWSSPVFNHCVFTAAREFDKTLGEKFTKLLTNMESDDPLIAELNRLEGTKKWIEGDSDGFESLVEALQEKEKQNDSTGSDR